MRIVSPETLQTEIVEPHHTIPLIASWSFIDVRQDFYVEIVMGSGEVLMIDLYTLANYGISYLDITNERLEELFAPVIQNRSDDTGLPA